MNQQLQLSKKYYYYDSIFKPILNNILQKSFDMARSKQKKVESQEQEQEEQYSIPEEQEEENLEDQVEDEHLDQLQVQQRKERDLLQIIAEQTKQGPEGERLTWLALHSLKQKQIELNQKMIQEVNALKDKYQLLKQPLFNKLASAALGKKVENQLYKPQGIQGTVDPSKVTPAPLPQYWVTVFEKSGLVQDQVDFEALRKLEDFSCELLDIKTNHLRLTFKFKEETAIFTNKILTLQVSKDSNPESSPKIVIKDPVKFKGKKVDQSIFTELFNPSQAPMSTFSLANQFYRDYCNSIYYYMRKDDIDIIDVDADESQQKSPVKAAPKKVKNDKPQKKELQKSDCKQQ